MRMRLRPEMEREPCLRVSLRFTRVACQAGAHPNKTPPINVTTTAKQRTGRFNSTTASAVILASGRMAMLSFMMADACRDADGSPEQRERETFGEQLREHLAARGAES